REDAVRAQGFDLARQLDDLVSVVPAGADQHGDFALGFFQRDLHHAQMVRAAERRALPGGAHGTRKLMPAAIWRRTNPRRVDSSKDRSWRNGVTRAVPHPVNMYHLLQKQNHWPQM